MTTMKDAQAISIHKMALSHEIRGTLNNSLKAMMILDSLKCD